MTTPLKPMTRVFWLDAQDHGENWVDQVSAEAFGDLECLIVSIGFVVRKTEKYLTLAADWDESDTDYGRVTKIPISMIVDMKELKEVE